MNLRMRVVEAGARAMFDADDAYQWEWDQYDEGVHGWYRRMSAIQTDATLDCLTENAGEWEGRVESFSAASMVYGETARRLVEVLREDR